MSQSTYIHALFQDYYYSNRSTVRIEALIKNKNSLFGTNLRKQLSCTAYSVKDIVSYQTARKVLKLTVEIIVGSNFYRTSHKNLFKILLSRLIPYVDEIIGDHLCGFRRNRSTTDLIFCIHQILKKKWEYNEYISYP
jgi:hypothetical protein